MFHVLSWFDDGLINAVVYLDGIIDNLLWCHLVCVTLGNLMGEINRSQPLLSEPKPIFPRFTLSQQEVQQVGRVLYVHLVGLSVQQTQRYRV